MDKVKHKVIFHLDLDAFFVSVERLNDPSLIGVPVVVGGNPTGRGVVAACSYEARKYGIHSAMPTRTAYKLCPTARFVRGSSGEYSRFSKIVRKILSDYAPVLEQASIDEFYMDFTGTKLIYGEPAELAKMLKKEIFEITALPSSIGIATNKTIAKIASDKAKPNGVFEVKPGEEVEFLRHLPVETMPGVGKVMSRLLRERGFYLLGDIAKDTSDYFHKTFGKPGGDLWEKANGKGSDILNPYREQKGVSREMTFKEDTTDLTYIKKMLAALSVKVAENLRDDGVQGETIHIKLRYSDFKTFTRGKTIKPTADEKVIYETALELFEKANVRRIAIRLIGVGVTKLSPYGEQGELFDFEDEKRKRLLKAVDLIRAKYGHL
jgi:DNA polymerase IV